MCGSTRPPSTAGDRLSRCENGLEPCWRCGSEGSPLEPLAQGALTVAARARLRRGRIGEADCHQFLVVADDRWGDT